MALCLILLVAVLVAGAEQEHKSLVENEYVYENLVQALRADSLTLPELARLVEGLAASHHALQHKTAPAPPSQSAPSTRTINLIYGLWDSKPMPAEFEGVRAFWAKEFPDLKDLWRRCRPIQRGWAEHTQTLTARLLARWHTVESIAHTASWRIRKGIPEYPTRIANYVFWAKPGSPLFQRALDLAVDRVRSLKDEDYAVTGASHLNNPYAIIYSTGPDVLTEATFPTLADGTRGPDAETLVIPRDKCYMTNRATGTWIGDNHPAWDRVAN